jgi:hypothetical protein
MAKIEVERADADGLSRQIWHFHLTTGFGSMSNVLRVELYASETRPTKRHKWVTLASKRYSSFDNRSYYSGIKAEDVPLPDDVLTEAKDILVKSIVVVGPAESYVR